MSQSKHEGSQRHTALSLDRPDPRWKRTTTRTLVITTRLPSGPRTDNEFPHSQNPLQLQRQDSKVLVEMLENRETPPDSPTTINTPDSAAFKEEMQWPGLNAEVYEFYENIDVREVDPSKGTCAQRRWLTLVDNCSSAPYSPPEKLL
jgi:hypothetical protein